MDPYNKATRRLKEKAKFKQHLAVYMVMGVFFITLNLVTSPYQMWWYFPMLGWGIGVGLHYFKAYGLMGYDDIDEDSIKDEIRRMKGGTRQKQLPEITNENWLPGGRPDSHPSSPPKWRDEDLV